MSLASMPLLAVTSLDATVAMHRDRPVAAREFVAAAEAIAATLPDTTHLVNLCENRYFFALAWCAACLRNIVTLLPPNQARGVLADLATTYPSQHVVDDAAIHDALQGLQFAHASSLSAHWQIPGNRIVALTFTSGSTGIPQVHAKSWATLSRNAQLACEQLLGGAGTRIVATVPAQHVYGLESSLISALTAGCTIYDGKPFFPQDVRAALAAIDGPRTLVTTPTHLQALLDSHIQFPAIGRVVSATAPLSAELARRIESAWSTAVFEIYGCTEAGIMAHRRTALGEQWETFRGGTVVIAASGPRYRAPQLPEPIPLQDLIETLDDTRFYLRGRANDMIKVAGKRTSLQDITRHLLAVPGVQDAAVFVPKPDARPVAIAVAPGLTPSAILSALSERVEAVFLPRPLLLVDALPRNTLGKLPRAALLQLWAERAPMKTDIDARICVPDEHPSLAGHFPGAPIVPGVVLLDLVLDAIQAASATELTLLAIGSAKFLQAVTPRTALDVRVKLSPAVQPRQLRARFIATRNEQTVLEGNFLLRVTATDTDVPT